MTPAAVAEMVQDFKAPAWERNLRMKLATLCMAAKFGKKGDLEEATKDILEFVRPLANGNQQSPSTEPK